MVSVAGAEEISSFSPDLLFGNFSVFKDKQSWWHNHG